MKYGRVELAKFLGLAAFQVIVEVLMLLQPLKRDGLENFPIFTGFKSQEMRLSCYLL